MLTSGFDRLPDSAKLVHTTALCLVGLNIILMMTPAALHRLSFGGEDSAEFLRLGSAFVIAGPVFLAAGISAEFYVVFLKSFSVAPLAISGAVCSIFGRCCVLVCVAARTSSSEAPNRISALARRPLKRQGQPRAEAYETARPKTLLENTTSRPVSGPAYLRRDRKHIIVRVCVGLGLIAWQSSRQSRN